MKLSEVLFSCHTRLRYSTDSVRQSIPSRSVSRERKLAETLNLVKIFILAQDRHPPHFRANMWNVKVTRVQWIFELATHCCWQKVWYWTLILSLWEFFKRSYAAKLILGFQSTYRRVLLLLSGLSNQDTGHYCNLIQL